jgi:hypothetical protein
MSGSNGDRDDTATRGGDRETPPDGVRGDTFGVGIHVTDTEFQFVVHVPSDIDAGWTDPEAFQRVVERAVWERLDRAATLRGIGERAATGETVTLGRITLTPDGRVLDAEFSAAGVES